MAGPPGDTAHIGLSDAGEPKGTAGRPMLTVLLHSGVGEIVAIGSRWFGGTKLGTGGLARAYSQGVQHALANLPTETKVERQMFEVAAGYEHVAALKRLFTDLDASAASETYGEGVTWLLGVPRDKADAFTSRVADITNGAAQVRALP